MEKILAAAGAQRGRARRTPRAGGPLGAPLKVVESYEKADWDTAKAFAAQTMVPEDMLPNLYLDALQWAALRLTMT